MRNKNNITLKKLCVIIIICFFCIFLLLNILQETYSISKLKNYVSKMELLQESVNEIRNKYILWEKYNPNEPSNYYSYLQELEFINANSVENIYKDEFINIINQINDNNSKYWNNKIDINITNYCYFTPQQVEQKFNLNDFENHVIINFYTGNIISKEGILDVKTKKLIHRQYDTHLGNSLKITQINNENVYAKLDIVENHGLKQKVKIELLTKQENVVLPDILEVYYLTKGSETKKKCSELKDYTYNYNQKCVMFTIDISNEYSFIVEDSNFIQYDKIDYVFELCNSPQLQDDMVGIYWDEDGVEHEIDSIYDENWYNYSNQSLKFANAKTEDGSYWVWIPRFVYKKNIDNIEINFVNGSSFTSTNKKPLNGFKTQEAFDEKDECLGFWINKFQINLANGMASSIPGKTLSVLKYDKAKNICLNYSVNTKMMSKYDYNAIMLLANFYGIQISNDLVHYAGGAPKIEGFLNNIKYSSTNNCFGVYDLITSENELILESKTQEEGRFRCIIK